MIGKGVLIAHALHVHPWWLQSQESKLLIASDINN